MTKLRVQNRIFQFCVPLTFIVDCGIEQHQIGGNCPFHDAEIYKCQAYPLSLMTGHEAVSCHVRDLVPAAHLDQEATDSALTTHLLIRCWMLLLITLATQTLCITSGS